MLPKIIENHSETAVNVAGIVRRILAHLPSEVLDELNEVIILDKNNKHSAFGAYWKSHGRIELYLDGITLWLPWILKKTYVIPYLFIGTALGHELDHHVNRSNNMPDKEASAETNAFKYVYPSLGIFRPIATLVSSLMRKRPFRKKFENP